MHIPEGVCIFCHSGTHEVISINFKIYLEVPSLRTDQSGKAFLTGQSGKAFLTSVSVMLLRFPRCTHKERTYKLQGQSHEALCVFCCTITFKTKYIIQSSTPCSCLWPCHRDEDVSSLKPCLRIDPGRVFLAGNWGRLLWLTKVHAANQMHSGSVRGLGASVRITGMKRKA